MAEQIVQTAGRKLTKRQREVYPLVEKGKLYTLDEAVALVKRVNYARFDASVDMHVRLGIDPRRSDQQVRGTVVLPHGTGKEKKVLVFCGPQEVEEALKAGADYAGLDELIEKIKQGWLEFDVVLATAQAMPRVAQIAKILGPRGLMPSPKTNTVVKDIASAVKEIKQGRITFRADRYGIVHASIGRVSFPEEHLKENAIALMRAIWQAKPPTAKGQYFKSVYIASTMSPSIRIDINSIKL